MLHRHHLLLLLCTLCLALNAQEICDNGIDDDGDNLIDLNDTTDCNCSIPPIVESLLPNPSFDQFSNNDLCTSIQPNGAPDALGQADCIAGWLRASSSTTDAWHLFTLPGAGPFWPAAIPQPIPSGVGAAGFFVGVSQASSTADGEDYREYLGACFENDGILQGEEYRLTFELGFAEDTPSDNGIVGSPSPITLGVYGITECGNIPFEGATCPETAGAVGWELIGEVTVSGTPGTWESVSYDFTATANYEAFAVGGSCDDPVIPNLFFWRNYYFVDELRLNLLQEFLQPTVGPISVGGDDICDPNAQMIATNVPNAAYQWYRNGVAITGATAQTYWPPQDNNFDGIYTVRITTADGCGLAEPVELLRPRYQSIFADSVLICPGGIVTISPNSPLISFNEAYDYLWEDGSTEPFLEVSFPGTYELTVTAFCEEIIESIVVTDSDRPTYQIIQTPSDPCVGDSVSFTIQSNWQWNFIGFFNPDSGESFQGLNQTFGFLLGPDQLELNFFAGAGCEDIFDDIFVEGGMLEVDATIVDLTCEAPVGSISLDIDDPNATLNWTNDDGQDLGSALNLPVSTPGNYTATVVSDDNCSRSETYTVALIDTPLDVTAAITNLSCDNPAGVINLTVNSTASLTYQWSDQAGNNLGSQAILTVAEPGDYSVLVTANGICTFTEIYTVIFDGALAFSIAIQDEQCENDGTASLDFLVEPGAVSIRWLEDGAASPFAQDVLSVADLSPGNYRVEVEEAINCSVTQSFVIAAITPLAVTTSIQFEDCSTSAGITLIAQPTGGTAPYEYAINNGPIQTSADFPALEEGDYAITVTDANGCTVISPMVSAMLPDVLSFEAGQDEAIRLGESVRLNAQIGSGGPEVATISWLPQDGGLSCTDCLNPVAAPVNTTTYSLNITTVDGCVYTDELSITVRETGLVYIPTAFSPNFDGVNDFFEVFPDQSVSQILELRIYDRWGGERYSYVNLPSDFPTFSDPPRWDGNFRGRKSSEGVYVYLLKVRLLNGKELSFSGDFLLAK